MNVRELPEYVGVAQSMSDFFGPEDAKDDEVLVRKGHIKSEAYGSVYGVMIFTAENSEWGLNWAFYGKTGSEWICEVDIVRNPDIEKLLKTYLV